jgi:hypothetical protein
MQSMKLFLVLFMLMSLSYSLTILTSSLDKKQNKNINLNEINYFNLPIDDIVLIDNKIKKHNKNIKTKNTTLSIKDAVEGRYIINNLNNAQEKNYMNKLFQLVINFIFDLDLEKGEDCFETFNFIKYKKEIEKILINILDNKLKFVWLNSSTNTKYSYHLILNVGCNNNQNKQIKNYLNETMGTDYLDDVYTSNRCLRMGGCFFKKVW